MDVLSAVLLNTRVLAASLVVLDLGESRGISAPDQPTHLILGTTVLEGRLRFESDGRPATELAAGDTVLLLRDGGHTSSTSTVTLAEFLTEHNIDQLNIDRGPGRSREIRYGDGAVRTRMLVFALLVHDAGPHSVVANLESAVVVRRSNTGGPAPWTTAALAFLSGNAAHSAGSAAVATKLVELAFTSLLREHIRTSSTIGRGWMRGLRDERIGQALACIHNRPEHPWTVETLGRRAGMARSTFARLFAELVGTSPIVYLADVRMAQACVHLFFDRQSVATVASASGYRSERAFRQASASRYGLAPTRYAARFRQDLAAGDARRQRSRPQRIVKLNTGRAERWTSFHSPSTRRSRSWNSPNVVGPDSVGISSSAATVR